MAGMRGEVAEGAVLSALLRLGCSVLLPFSASEPYDLVVDRGEAGFVRIQCKTGWERDGCILFNSCSTDHGRGRLDYRGRADLFAVCFPPSFDVFIVPVAEAASRTTRLRLRPSANNQKHGVRQAADHRLDRWRASLLPSAAGVRQAA